MYLYAYLHIIYIIYTYVLIFADQVMNRPLTMPSPMRLPVEPALAKVAWTYLDADGTFADVVLLF